VNSLAIMDLFRDVWATGTAVIFVTHSPELAEMAPRRIVMRDGEIVARS
jgi:ABC-type lipoprotein export system ATPase subunit